jgi:general stress protein 26
LAIINRRLLIEEIRIMKIQQQTTAELTQLAELIDNIEIAMLTMHDRSGALLARPMAPLEMDGQGAFWFLTDQNSMSAEYLDVVNLSFSDEKRSTYVSLAGHAEMSFDRVRINQLWTEFARPWFPNGPESNGIALLKFVPASAEYWDAPNSRMVRMFAMAASIAAGKPVGLGEHETLHNLAAGASRVADTSRAATDGNRDSRR